MASCFNFQFDELPLLISKEGTEACLIDGQVSVEYDRSGGWWVDNDVFIAGYPPRTNQICRRTYIRAPDPLATLIIERLHTEWRDCVEDEVFRHIAEDREADADKEHVK
jgi:hypothetical protein